jgi:hypothetical protein
MADDIPSLSVHPGEPYDGFLISARLIYAAPIDTTVGAITSCVLHLLQNDMWKNAGDERFVSNAVEDRSLYHPASGADADDHLPCRARGHQDRGRSAHVVVVRVGQPRRTKVHAAGRVRS